MRIDWRKEKAGDVDLWWRHRDGLAVSLCERDEVRYEGCRVIAVVLLARAHQLSDWEDRVGVRYLCPAEHILENIARLVPQPTAYFEPEKEVILQKSLQCGHEILRYHQR